MDWDNLQLNVPIIASPGRFYIANAGSAVSKGVEVELRARPWSWCEVFGSAGYVNAEFLSGSQENGVSISGNDLPYTPEFTGQLGVQLTWAPCKQATLYARAEGVVYGNFAYDSSNAAGQDTYSLANFRAGVRGRHWFVEGWVNNAFNTEYAPIALPYSTSFAPSGYIAEPGAPLTYGIRGGVEF
jgi:iron complex outermembrane receptor protein